MPDVAPGQTIAVIAAMVPEVRPVVRALGLTRTDRHRWLGRYGDRPVVAAVTCMGTAAAVATTEEVLDAHDVGWVLAIGVCGAIDPDLVIGQLVVPTTTFDETAGVEATPTPLPGHAPVGRLLTTDVLHADPDVLAARRAEGFVAVDMETAAIGRVCADRGVPWSVARAVSDRAGDPAVDAELVGMANPDGTPNGRAVARYLLRHPGRIPAMATLGRGLRAAVGTSTSATLAAIASPDGTRR